MSSASDTLTVPYNETEWNIFTFYAWLWRPIAALRSCAQTVRVESPAVSASSVPTVLFSSDGCRWVMEEESSVGDTSVWRIYLSGLWNRALTPKALCGRSLPSKSSAMHYWLRPPVHVTRQNREPLVNQRAVFSNAAVNYSLSGKSMPPLGFNLGTPPGNEAIMFILNLGNLMEPAIATDL